MSPIASVDAAAEATFSAFGNVHILCNNAGVGARGGVEQIALDNWRWVLDVNLIGVVTAYVPSCRICERVVRVNTSSTLRRLQA
jgi:NAD(P)-dependent dehydrogenase (short-subunit alcohol dehydrogenase family)